MIPTEAHPKYRTSPDAVFETFDDEIIIINMVTGSYYSLDATALGIWNLLQGQQSLSHVVRATQNAYQDDAETIESTVTKLVEELEGEGLLVRINATDAPVAAAPTASAPAASTSDDGNAPHNGTTPDSRPPFQAPKLTKFTDMQELLLLDPIHEVDEMGWPHARPEGGAAPQASAPLGTPSAPSA